MKKTIQIIAILLVLTLLSIGQAFAYPVSDGETVYLSAWETDSSVLGKDIGNWSVYGDSSKADYRFETFCIEKSVTYYNMAQYSVTIDAKIKTSHEDIGKELKLGTKYLYWNFFNGTLDGYDGTDTDVSALQDAFWGLQADATSGNEFFDLAKTYTGDGTELDVMVMNLWDGNSKNYQSQLIAGAPVPEPTTMVLLGSGLIGLALYRRKMKK